MYSSEPEGDIHVLSIERKYITVNISDECQNAAAFLGFFGTKRYSKQSGLHYQ